MRNTISQRKSTTIHVSDKCNKISGIATKSGLLQHSTYRAAEKVQWYCVLKGHSFSCAAKTLLFVIPRRPSGRRGICFFDFFSSLLYRESRGLPTRPRTPLAPVCTGSARSGGLGRWAWAVRLGRCGLGSAALQRRVHPISILVILSAVEGPLLPAVILSAASAKPFRSALRGSGGRGVVGSELARSAKTRLVLNWFVSGPGVLTGV